MAYVDSSERQRQRLLTSEKELAGVLPRTYRIDFGGRTAKEAGA